MDPTHFLSCQAFQHQDTGNPGQGEIGAFYDEHGREIFAAFPRWCERLKEIGLGLRNRRSQPARFAPEARRG